MREVKYSGAEWIGDIPTGWEITKIGNVYSERRTKVSDRDYRPLSVTNKGILPQLSTAAKTDAHDDRKLVKIGDFAINSRSDRRGSCGISPYEGSVSLINTILSPRIEMYAQYYNWLFHSSLFADEFYKWGHGIVDDLWTTNWQDMKKIIIPLPPISEQKRIAAYLDSECSEIDALISRTRESIVEYKKMRNAVIAEAITKGVRGKRAVKESGLEWVPELPVEWTTIPSKFLFRNSDLRKQPDDEQLTASQKYGIISQREYMERENTKIVLANKGLEDWKHLEPYDFVISLRSFQGGLEMSETTGCITWHYIVLKPCKPIVSKYFKWLFKSEIYIKALQRTCNFIRDGQDLRYSNFVQVPLFEPPLDEQQEIADYLDQKCAEIDDLIAKKERFLVELENYKKALIYEYVTGKKEVPAEQPTTMSIVYPYFPAALNTDKRRFAQAILMCRILDKCRKKMGRVKLEKMLYTIESSIGFDLETEYVREAAGPLDASIYECERIISKRNKWYTLKSSSYGVSYAPTKDSGKYEKYYDKYFASYDAEIDRIINIFMNYDADQAEIVATLFAAWNDFIIDQRQFSDEELVDEVLNNWNDSKKRFPRDVWLRAIDQMRKNNIIPSGYGKRTVVKN